MSKSSCVSSENVVKIRDHMAYRGPDDKGLYTTPDGNLLLAHARLSIIDLSPAGHQPMSNKDDSVWLSYNGEIYNYRELRKDLKGRGREFISNSDTEAIIAGYEEWGIDDLLKRLRGMFAFAIYDSRTEKPKLILARDRFGIKPLYYYMDNKLLIFASEVRAIAESGLIPTERSEEADIAFLVFGHIPAPLTTIKNVFSLPPASYMLIENGSTRIERYYDLLSHFLAPKKTNAEKVCKQIESMLTDVVDIHLISDAPLGVFLSGGIDSSGLVGLASNTGEKRITTLSIIFDEEGYSEKRYQQTVAERFKTDHRETRVTERDFYGELNSIFDAMDQPTVDSVNTYFVSQAAKREGLKTVLSGAGADEVFCGYESFRMIGFLKKINANKRLLRYPLVLAENLNDKWRKLRYLLKDEPINTYLAIRGLFAPQDVARILGILEDEVEDVIKKIHIPAEASNLAPIDWLSYMEISLYLQNQLLKDTDFMGMRHSVETRVPYLDHILVEFVASVDPTLKVDRKTPKPLLAKPLENLLPNEVVSRKKWGFTFPFDLWLKRGGGGLFREAASKIDLSRGFEKEIWRKFEIGQLHWSKAWGLIVMGKERSR